MFMPSKLSVAPFVRSRKPSKRLGIAVLATVAFMGLSACTGSQQVLQHGYQLNEESLALVPEGSSREQVQLSLGTPSTTESTPDGNETFYYISQKKVRTMAFSKSKLVDQRVVAIYFDDEDTVQQIANYGLKDGKVFDFIGRVTPTGGKELTFLAQILGAAGAIANPFGGAPGSR